MFFILDGQQRRSFGECPVCKQEYQRDTGVMLCLRGHFTCEQCYLQIVDPKVCPLCRALFSGRAVDFENNILKVFL